MPWVTDEQIARAREVDLLSYLQASEPQELKRSGPGEYRTVSHGSLVISNGRWMWNRGGFGGRSAVDYLIRVRGMRFNEAVETVLGARVASFPLPGEAQKPHGRKYTFYPPKPSRYASNVTAYLQRRGISPRVIGRAIQLGILYESRYYNPQSKYHNAPVCVFAGRDGFGNIVFAALRGTDTDLKIDKAGSDKRHSFYIPAKYPDSRHLAVFEAPIDALSHAALQQRGGWKWSGYRLSLGGTSSAVLISFLERNPQITRVVLHLDSDAAGQRAARKIKAELTADSRFKRIRVSVNPPRRGKDYNDVLLHAINTEREQKQQSRRKADILI
jgi:hypothetical protein